MYLILRKRTLLITILVWWWAMQTSLAQAPTWAWANAVRSDLGQDYNKAIAIDNQGNAYTTGNMNEGVNGAGADRAFIRKYNSSGTLLWQKTISNIFTNHAMNSSDIAVNSTGTEVYISGAFSGKMAFSNAVSIDVGGSQAVFLAKYDAANGNLQWVRTGTTTSLVYNDQLIELDDLGNVYLTGVFDGDLQFGSVNLTNGFEFKAIYLVKYNTNGTPLSAQRVAYIEYIADDNDFNLNDFEVDGSGSTFYTGDFRGTANINGTFVNSSGGGSDIFVLRNAVNGNAMWRRQYSGGLANLNGIDKGLVLELDNLGNVIFGGFFTASLSIGNINLQASVNSVSGFLAKLDGSGNPIWAIKPTDQSTAVKTLAVAGSDYIYVSGDFLGNATFGNNTLNSSNGDFYLARFNANGQAQWGAQAEPQTSSNSANLQLGVNSALIDQVYAAGSFDGSATFGAFNLNGSTNDTYLAKLTLLTPICQTPSPVTVSNITVNSAQIGWQIPTSALQIEMRYRKVGDANWQNQIFGRTQTSVTLNVLSASSQYEVQVRSICNNNQLSDWASVVNFTTATPVEPCIVPNTLNISQITNNSVYLSWVRPNFAAKQYDIRYRKANENIWTNIAVSGFNTEISDLEPLTTYIVQIRSYCGNGVNSSYSADYQFITTSPAVCNIPQNLRVASQTPNFAQIGWESAGNGVHYEVRYKLAQQTTWTTGLVTTNSIQITPVFSGTAYQIQVRSKCSNTLFSNWSGVFNFTTMGAPACGVPSGLIGQNITNNSINLTWVNGNGAGSYLLRYKASNQTTWTTLNTSFTQVNLTNLIAGTTYQVQVQSICDNGLTSAFTAVFSFTTTGVSPCQTPTVFSADVVGQNVASVIWATANGAIGYEIRYRSALTTTWTTVRINDGTIIRQELSNLLSGTQYFAQIRSICANNAVSAFSRLTSFTTLGNPVCVIPTGLNANSISINSVMLIWGRAAGAIAYDIRYRSNLTTTWTTIRVNDGSVISQILGNLLSGTTYFVQIRTICANGLATTFSPVLSFTTLGNVTCAVPSGLAVQNIANNSATFTWSNTNAAMYEVRYRPEISRTWISANTSTNSLIVNNLLSGTKYFVQVRAKCAGNLTTAFTALISFNTSGAIACAIPANLRIDRMTNHTATLLWEGVNGANQYELFYRPEFSTRWINVIVSGNSYTLQNLLAGTKYFIFIRSRCDFGLASLNSAPISFFTIGTPFCGNVSNLQASNISPNSVTLTWTGASGANQYEVQYRLKGVAVYTTQIVNGNTINLTNLVAGQVYQVRVRALCNDNYASLYLNSGFNTSLAFTPQTEQVSNQTQVADNQEINQNKPMQVYPNPSNGRVNVQKTIASMDKSQIQVLDKMGNLVFKQEQTGNIQTELNLQHLPKGIYYLKLISTEKSEIQRLVIE
jgi:hypothetical protein